MSNQFMNAAQEVVFSSFFGGASVGRVVQMEVSQAEWEAGAKAQSVMSECGQVWLRAENAVGQGEVRWNSAVRERERASALRESRFERVQAFAEVAEQRANELARAGMSVVK